MTPGEALAAVMFTAAVALAVSSRGAVARLAWHMVAGLVLIRMAIWYAPADWRYLASTAIWCSVGVAAVKRGTVTSGALLILSGLCYGAAEWFAAPATFGSPALVGADIFWWAALLWAGAGGYFADDHGDSKRPRVGGGDRGCVVVSGRCMYCDGQTQARQAVRPE